jgi:molybdopterin/thiamine biosynthesis adenylyltransferase
MTASILTLDATATDGRYHRQELISWWDQSRLSAARVLVVGAGALGNEIVKSLALLGVGHLDIVDMDQVEHANLARCVLFRDGDEGRPKAEVVAAAVGALNPDVTAVAHTVPVQQLGLGFLDDVDLVIAGLDNREARLWVAQSCRKLGQHWVDGAIEGLRGLVRVFLPEGACYECTLGETDRKIMAQRRACALLSAEEMATGKVPTNATTASIIAAIEVQEAVKLIVGRADLLALRNSALMYVGETLETYKVTYAEDELCLSHDRYEDLIPFAVTAETSLTDVVIAGRLRLGGHVDAVELEDDLIVEARCGSCGHHAPVLRSLRSLSAGDGLCPACGEELTLDARRVFDPTDDILAARLLDLHLADRDVITVRAGDRRTHFALDPAQPTPRVLMEESR